MDDRTTIKAGRENFLFCRNIFSRRHDVWENVDKMYTSNDKRMARVNKFYRPTVKPNDHIAHIYPDISLPDNFTICYY